MTSLVVGSQSPTSDNEWGVSVLTRQFALTYREVLASGAVMEAAAANLDLAPSALKEGVSAVSVWMVPDTTMVRLAVEGHDPGLAMHLANEMVSVFASMHQESEVLQGALIDIVQPATLPVEPVGPRIWLNTMVATMGGCALAVGMALLLEYLGAAPTAAEDTPLQGDPARGSTSALRAGQRRRGASKPEPD